MAPRVRRWRQNFLSGDRITRVEMILVQRPRRSATAQQADRGAHMRMAWYQVRKLRARPVAGRRDRIREPGPRKSPGPPALEQVDQAQPLPGLVFAAGATSSDGRRQAPQFAQPTEVPTTLNRGIPRGDRHLEGRSGAARRRCRAPTLAISCDDDAEARGLEFPPMPIGMIETLRPLPAGSTASSHTVTAP